MKTQHTLLWSIAATILLFAGIVFLWQPQTAEAQCGSSASSCKTCHETQGADPVNTVGDWHTQHAFGDFCEFCHAGNVQATDKDGAHQGLASPLEDVAASCQSCHPDDMMARAEKYASTLGIELGADSSAGGGEDTPAGTDGASAAPVTGVAAPLGGEEIDMNLLYAEKTAPEPVIKNWGNFILTLMSILVAGAFLVTAWTWEGWSKSLARWIENNVAPITDAIAEKNAAFAAGESPAAASSAEMAALLARKPELAALLPKLMDGDPALLADLNRILSNQPEGARLLHAVSRFDAKLISTLKDLDNADRSLLLALIKEL